MREREARRNAGDPGPVLARRLSNAEFDYTIRDLTGVDIRPTREFPVDPANEAGFDNSGESLAMSPALLKKYLAAARLVADHLVLMPDGFGFAPHPAVTDTDRDKYCVRRIIDFYQRHEVDYADYFLAAWRFQHRAELGKPRGGLGRLRRRGRAEPQVSRHDLGDPDRTRPGPKAGPLGRAAGAVARSCRPTPRRRPRPGAIASGCATWSSACGKAIRAARARDRRCRGISQGEPALRALEEPPARRAADAVSGRGQAADAPELERFCRVFPDTFFVTDRAPVLRPEERHHRGGC